MTPRCLGCGKRLAEVMDHRPRRVEVPGGFMTVTDKVPTGRYGYLGNGYFCTLRCGFQYGVSNARARGKL